MELSDTINAMAIFKLEIAVIVIINLLPIKATVEPKYEIHPWDKNQEGGFLIVSGVQCNCFWCHDVHGVRTPVSNDTVLNFTQDDEYGEYYLFDEPSQFIAKYALVVPHGNAGSPYESNFLELHPCRTGISNKVEFYFTMNINERAITTRNQCDLRWNGLPECVFDNGPCPYNGNNSMDEYSVRCRLAIDEENYISSFPIMIGEVDSLPLCPSANISITVSSSITASSSGVITNATPLPGTYISATSTTTYQTTTSSTTNTIYQMTVISTLVNHASPATIPTPDASTSATPTTSSSSERTIIIVISVICSTIAFVLLAVLILKVCVCRKILKKWTCPKNCCNGDQKYDV